MPILNYQYLLIKKNLFQVVTGFSSSQFQNLLPKFSLALRRAEYQRIPPEKRLREVGGGRKSKLGGDELVTTSGVEWLPLREWNDLTLREKYEFYNKILGDEIVWQNLRQDFNTNFSKIMIKSK